MATDKERSFCETTCRTASKLGFGLRRDAVQGLFTQFTWRTPQGAILEPQAAVGEQQALVLSCRALSARLAGL